MANKRIRKKWAKRLIRHSVNLVAESISLAIRADRILLIAQKHRQSNMFVPTIKVLSEEMKYRSLKLKLDAVRYFAMALRHWPRGRKNRA